MSGKEALRHVSDLSGAQVRALYRVTRSATTRLVCKWRLTELNAFEELAVYASGKPLRPEMWTTPLAQQLCKAFAEWTNPTPIARSRSVTRRNLLQQLNNEAKRGHLVLERRMSDVGELEWRARPYSKDEENPKLQAYVTYRAGRVRVAALLFIGLFFGASAHAATLYVDGTLPIDCAARYSTATRTCTGSDGSGYATFASAVAAMQPGDTVLIRGGTYRTSLVVTKNGTAAAHIRFVAYPGERPVIDLAGVTEQFIPGITPSGIESSGRSFIDYDGLSMVNIGQYGIRGSCPPGGVCPSNITITNCEVSYIWNGGIVIEGGSNIIVDNCDVHHTNQRGIFADAEAITLWNVDRFEVKNSTVHDNGEEGIDAKYGAKNGSIHHNKVFNNGSVNVYCDGCNDVSIYNNEIHASATINKGGLSVGIEGYDQDHKAFNLNIYNNLIYDHSNGISFYFQYADALFSNITIANNVIYNNNRRSQGWKGALYVEGFARHYSNIVLRNNILWENQGDSGPFRINPGGISFVHDPAEGDITVFANWAIDHNVFKTGEVSDTYGTNSVIVPDIRWVNGLGADFHLVSGSPAIDAGSATGAPRTDYDGVARPQGAAYDIGAFEFSTSVIPPASVQPPGPTRVLIR